MSFLQCCALPATSWLLTATPSGASRNMASGAYARSTACRPAFAQGAVPAVNASGLPRIPLSHPTPIEDVFADPTLSDRSVAYEDEGIRSALAIPLAIDGAPTASLAFYYRSPHKFTDVEVESAGALGHLAAVALTTARLYDEQRRTREHAAFLARPAPRSRTRSISRRR